MTLQVDARPCSSCPYRQDAPSGLWAHEEYTKLRNYDEQDGALLCLNLFLCHHTDTVDGPDSKLCRGWLTVHQDSIAVRIGILDKRIDPTDAYAAPTVPLFSSGNAAADHGEADLEVPGRRARAMVDRLLERNERVHL